MNRSLVVRYLLAIIVVSSLTALIAVVAHAAAATPQAQQVTIDNFSFAPAELKVKTGTKVEWVNHDDVPHTIVNTDMKFKSRALDTSESFSYTFDQPGIYEYFCSLHPRMTAKIVVEPGKQDDCVLA